MVKINQYEIQLVKEWMEVTDREESKNIIKKLVENNIFKNSDEGYDSFNTPKAKGIFSHLEKLKIYPKFYDEYDDGYNENFYKELRKNNIL